MSHNIVGMNAGIFDPHCRAFLSVFHLCFSFSVLYVGRVFLAGANRQR